VKIESASNTAILEHVICNLCCEDDTFLRFPSTLEELVDSASWEAFRCTHPGYGIHPPIVQCKHCGLVYTDPRPRRDAIKRNYEIVEDPLYLQERSARELTFEKHLHSFEKFTGPAQGRRLLDVGAYLGVFVEIANNHGWDAWGLEPSFWASNYARERGLNMTQGTLEEANFLSSSFDAITMWDVIEHLGDPLSEMRHVQHILKPGGWIAVHTMDVESRFAKLMGSRWPWLMEMHVYFFSRPTLTKMLEAAGFQVVTVRSEGRYLRLKYLTTRLRPYSKFLGDVVEGITGTTELDKIPLRINLGDLITAYARKP